MIARLATGRCCFVRGLGPAAPESPVVLHELTVPREAAGQRLDLWLASALPGCTRSLVQRLM